LYRRVPGFGGHIPSARQQVIRIFSGSYDAQYLKANAAQIAKRPKNRRHGEWLSSGALQTNVRGLKSCWLSGDAGEALKAKVVVWSQMFWLAAL
jgi:hypothetical protein